MTLVYSVKKCKAYGFAQSIENAIALFPNSNREFYVICEEHRKELMKDINGSSVTFINETSSMENINESSSAKNNNVPVFIVELATTENIEAQFPIENDDMTAIQEYIDNNPIKFDTMSKIEINECLEIVRNISENGEFLKGKTMNFKFYNFIKIIYGILKDTLFKTNLLRILSESEDVAELEFLYPIKYETKKIDRVVNSKLFRDIEIIVDKKADGKSNTMYKTSEADLKQASLGNSTQLEAFSKGMFTIIRGKKSANLDNYGDQNHDVLDILARNGVVCTPDSLKNSSLDKLMNMLSTFNSFEVVFIHPSLMYKKLYVEFPSEQGKPEYNMNEGELIAVVFRYLCLKFFGYKGIYDEHQREYDYLF